MRLWTVAALAAVLTLSMDSAAANAATDPNLLCHKHVVKQLEKYKKTYLKLYRNCIDKENRGDIPGPCLDSVSEAKLALTNTKVVEGIAKKCTMATIAAIGYQNNCQYGASTPGVGGTCFGLPVTTPSEFAECMKCWKGAEFGRYIATLYASHAVEVCDGALDNTSPTCSEVGCTTPLPNQVDLGDNAQNDCQRMLSKASLNYLLKREKILDKCLLRGSSYGACLADLKVDAQLQKAEIQKETLILNFCNNYVPVADPPFCCRTGPGQACVLAADRNDCEMNLGGNVMEGRTCEMGTCENQPGPNKELTWWEHCPTNDPCPGPTLGDIDGVIDCVDGAADELVGNLLCLQFPGSGTCPTPVPTETPTPTITPTP